MERRGGIACMSPRRSSGLRALGTCRNDRRRIGESLACMNESLRCVRLPFLKIAVNENGRENSPNEVH